ncbi:hypothetical protein GCWU000341_00457 [Oribacterium sp. oral taxon 078 str. F0262]|uniref:hypothetical protein n=1 Tax=Oribacterium sp. oral taxon 078 TaxID=652706 RepID=UPI0001BCBBA2|nr:hypothetical protein [Oribacterium sp. oral taxon 078]EFE92575.1 hypothetical protein GCWU000341_00457 [Oribacterium sp. oral taxon 078 str. F0262]
MIRIGIKIPGKDGVQIEHIGKEEKDRERGRRDSSGRSFYEIIRFLGALSESALKIIALFGAAGAIAWAWIRYECAVDGEKFYGIPRELLLHQEGLRYVMEFTACLSLFSFLFGSPYLWRRLWAERRSGGKGRPGRGASGFFERFGIFIEKCDLFLSFFLIGGFTAGFFLSRFSVHISSFVSSLSSSFEEIPYLSEISAWTDGISRNTWELLLYAVGALIYLSYFFTWIRKDSMRERMEREGLPLEMRGGRLEGRIRSIGRGFLGIIQMLGKGLFRAARTLWSAFFILGLVCVNLGFLSFLFDHFYRQQLFSEKRDYEMISLHPESGDPEEDYLLISESGDRLLVMKIEGDRKTNRFYLKRGSYSFRKRDEQDFSPLHFRELRLSEDGEEIDLFLSP